MCVRDLTIIENEKKDALYSEECRPSVRVAPRTDFHPVCRTRIAAGVTRAEEFGDPAGRPQKYVGHSMSRWTGERGGKGIGHVVSTTKTIPAENCFTAGGGPCAPGTPVIGQDRRNKGVHGHNRGSTSGCGPVRTVPTSPEHRVPPLSTLYRR